jgi:phage terminase small subunit
LIALNGALETGHCSGPALFVLGRSLADISPKQAVFVAAYLGEANRNASEAARIAGYAKPGQQSHRLLKNVEIQAAIEEKTAEIERRGIALHQNRVDALVARHKLMNQVIEERAAHPFYADVPGGTTGIVLKRLKTVKHVYDADPDDPDGKPSQMTVESWEVEDNVTLLRELREHEKQIAQELGEWVDKQQFDGSSTQVVEIVGVDASQI